MGKINETMLVNDIIDMDPDVVKIFLENGLNCQGCPGASNESIREAAEGHGIGLERLLDQLNKYFDQQ